jgi:hypothetical protein
MTLKKKRQERHHKQKPHDGPCQNSAHRLECDLGGLVLFLRRESIVKPFPHVIPDHWNEHYANFKQRLLSGWKVMSTHNGIEDASEKDSRQVQQYCHLDNSPGRSAQERERTKRSCRSDTLIELMLAELAEPMLAMNHHTRRDQSRLHAGHNEWQQHSEATSSPEQYFNAER